MSRKSNQVVIRLDMVPEVEFPLVDDVILGFTVQFTHHVNNTTATNLASGGAGSGGSGSATPNLAGGGAQIHALTSRVYVNLGKVAVE